MKKVVVLLLLACLWGPVAVYGHSALLSSTPAEGESVEMALDEVHLNFEGAIEQGSTMSIKNEEENFEFEDIIVSEQAMIGILPEALPNSTYTVVWKVISADGHPLEGEIFFEVNVENGEEEPTAEEETTTDAPQPDAEEMEIPETSEPVEEDSNNWLVTLLIAAAAVLMLFGLYGLFFKKR